MTASAGARTTEDDNPTNVRKGIDRLCARVSNRDMTNTNCPDYSSHSENAADRLFPGVEVLTAEQSEAVDAEAEIEYLACEGH